jgi:hypothetical protein
VCSGSDRVENLSVVRLTIYIVTQYRVFHHSWPNQKFDTLQQVRLVSRVVKPLQPVGGGFTRTRRMAEGQMSFRKSNFW